MRNLCICNHIELLGIFKHCIYVVRSSLASRLKLLKPSHGEVLSSNLSGPTSLLLLIFEFKSALNFLFSRSTLDNS